VLLPVSRVLRETGAPAWESEVRPYLQVSLAMIAQRTMDEDVRVRWLRGPFGAEMAELAGSIDLVGAGGSDANGQGPSEDERLLLASLVRGRTNQEIGEDLGIDEAAVTRRLGELFATIGVSSRADATAFAFRENIL
jgi:DNA-binding NarL/FixJ family response regulator